MIRHSILFLCFSFIVSFHNLIQAQEVSDADSNGLREELMWTGNSSQEWDDPLNWDIGEIPDLNSNVSIPDSPTSMRFPIINSETEAVCNNLAIEPGSLLQLRGFLTVGEELINTDENALIILSDDSGTGSLIFNSENVSATVQRYLSDGTSHFFGASINSATVNDLYFNQDPDVFLYRYDESTGTWPTISDLNTPLSQGIGYSVYVFDSKNKGNVTASFIGLLLSNDLTLPQSVLSYTEASPYPGSNLISNPFSSAMSWDMGNWEAQNINGSIWLWNGSYNYLFRNAHGMGSLDNGIIPVSQAFFIKTIASNATLTLSANDRVHSNQNFYKSNERENEAHISLEVKKQDKSDEVWVAFCEDCTDDKDLGWDTEKSYGNVDAPQLFINKGYGEMSIDAIPLLGSETKTLELHFIAGESGEHSISLSDFNNGGMEGIAVLLKDLFENTEQFLSMNPTYYFNADINDAENRFEIDIWEMPLGIPNKLEDAYLIYSFENTVRVKPIESSTNGKLIVRIFDLSGRLIIEQENSSGDVTAIPIQTRHSYVVVSLITDESVINKKLYVK